MSHRHLRLVTVRFLRSVAAILLMLPGLFFAVGLLLVMAWNFILGSPEWQLRNGPLVVVITVLSLWLAWSVWPRRREAKLSHPHSQPN